MTEQGSFSRRPTAVGAWQSAAEPARASGCLWYGPTMLPAIGTSVESRRFDAKAKYNIASGAIHQEIAKDIAAMANADGGRILVGSVEQAGFIVAHPGLTRADAVATRKAFENALKDNIRPSPIVDFPDPIPVDDDRVVLVIEIQPFPGQAIGVHVGGMAKDPWFFPVRVGTQTVFYAPDQLVLLMDIPHRRKIQMLQAAKGGRVKIQQTIPKWDTSSDVIIREVTVDEIDDLGGSINLSADGPACWISTTSVRDVWRAGDTWILWLAGLLIFRPEEDILQFVSVNPPRDS